MWWRKAIQYRYTNLCTWSIKAVYRAFKQTFHVSRFQNKNATSLVASLPYSLGEFALLFFRAFR